MIVENNSGRVLATADLSAQDATSPDGTAGPPPADHIGRPSQPEWLLPASRHWAAVARNRQRFPAYTSLLPRTATGILAVEVLMISLISLVGSYLLWNRGHSLGQLLLLVGFFSGFYVLGGVRRGQDNYSIELDRALSLGPVLGLSPARLYIESTLHAARRRYLTCALAFPVSMALCGLSAGAPASAVAVAVLSAGLLPVLAMLLREAIAHLSVGLRRIMLPKYSYLLAGLLIGLAVTSLLSLTSLQRPAAGPRAGAGSLSIIVAPLACALEVLAAILLFRATAALASRVARRVKPIGLEARPKWWRPPAFTPLCILMWRSRGRGRSSVIIGFTAMVLTMILEMRRLGGVLPGSASHAAARQSATYLRPEFAVVLLYAVIYFSGILFEAPLEMRLVKRRLPLLTIASVRPTREVWDLFAGMLVPVGAVALLTGLRAARLGLFPGVPLPVVLAIAFLLAVGGGSVVVSAALGGGAFSAGRSTSDDFTALYLKAGLTVLLPAMLVAGFSATHALRNWQVAAVAVLPVLAGALVLGYMQRFIRRQFSGGR
jgi:hypothetical protein